METYHGYKTLSQPLAGAVVAVGNFDGVHRGHQEIIRRVLARAQILQVPGVLYTFTPHPVKVLVPHLAPPLITPYATKRSLLGLLGVDVIIEEPFDRSFAAYSPEQFVTEVLHQALNTREIFVGYDFTFGRGGKATVETLRQLGEPFGMQVHLIEPLSFEGIVASSTKVREFVREGQVDGAALLLGRLFALHGTIEAGEQRGRTIGFPTANLATTQELLPAHGVYACWAEIENDIYPAVTNIGMRPTFHGTAPTIEAHIIDFTGDLYGATMTLSFQQRLRAEQAFSSLDELKQQIQRDVQQARNLLDVTPAPNHPLFASKETI